MNTHQSWTNVLSAYKETSKFKETLAFVEQERQQGKVIYPNNQDVFIAFKLCAFDQLKVVILGQDPYHNVGQAHGLAFSVQAGVKPPPSLINVYKELKNDLNIPISQSGDLTAWARQGAFLLNTVLTVEAHQAHSHANRGWENFTDYVISKISQYKKHVVFLLWGAPAQKKANLIDNHKHLILKAPHPSPLSAHRGFIGSKHFSQTNQYLLEHGLQPIDWKV